MTELLRKFAPAILAEIDKSSHILLHCHPKPDGDSVGGTLAMMLALQQLGKEVTAISGDSIFPGSMKHFPSAQMIKQMTYAEVDLSQFDLFIIQDSASVNMISKKTEVTWPKTLKTIAIDHHSTNTNFADINLIDTSYQSVCQILHDLFISWKIKITKDIAVNLFMGIYTDTLFKYKGTTWETFDVASKLVKIVPDFDEFIFKYENNNDEKNIGFLRLAINSIDNPESSSVAMIAISKEQLEANCIEKEFANIDNLVNLLISVKSWKIGITAIETEPGIVSVSFRTRDSNLYDVSKIALLLGGGGHKAAAGASLHLPFKQACEKIITVIGDTYPELFANF